MHGLLRYNVNAGVHARGRNGLVTQRCHNSPDWKRSYRVRVMSRTGSAQRIWGILKKSVSGVEFLARKKTVGFRLLAEARPVTLWWVPHVWGGGANEKSQNRNNVYLSPYVEKPLNSKVIKSFVSELRSVFRVSRFLCSMYICYEHSYVHFTHSRIMVPVV